MEELVKIPGLAVKGAMKSTVVKELLHKRVLEQLREINLNAFKMDNKLTEMVMQIIEIGCKEHPECAIDKKQCVIDILKEYHTLSNDEANKIANQIQYIYDNKLIKKNIKSIIPRICNKISKLTLGKKI